MRFKRNYLWIFLAVMLNGCLAAQAGPATITPGGTNQQFVQAVNTVSPTVSTGTPDELPSQAAPTGPPEVSPVTPPVFELMTPTTPPTLGPDEWQALPIIPVVSESVRTIYQRGLELGNNSQAFSKIGDCGSTPAWFLGDFDRGSKYYRLGEFHNLQPVIEAFEGSYSRTSLAAKSGFNASSVFTILWSDRSMCEANETPIACEYRLNRPVVAFVTLGTNDVFHQEKFEPQLRNIIEFSIEQGVIPILSTKADDVEKDGRINATIARLAREYDLPLWNYWLAVQPLPDHGLQEDGVHLTWGPNRFDDPRVMTTAWAVRNLTALQTLDVVWRVVTDQSPAQP
jgi:hypothetical protein